MIKLENVSYKYKNNQNVLENINLQINENECIAIIGANGTGKSTLAKLISGILKPTEGNVFVDEINTREKKEVINLRRKIGIVFQNPENQIIFNKIYDDISFSIKNLELKNIENRITEALKTVDMLENLEKPVYELSLGQKQRVAIASTLAIGSKYLCLDEATAMLDSKGKKEIYKIINHLKQNGYTIIYTTNVADEILMADKIIILDNLKIAKIIEKKELQENVETLKKYGIELPKILKILELLKQEGLNIKLDELTDKELVKKLVQGRKTQ